MLFRSTCSQSHHLWIGVAQAAAQQRQGGAMAPGGADGHGLTACFPTQAELGFQLRQQQDTLAGVAGPAGCGLQRQGSGHAARRHLADRHGQIPAIRIAGGKLQRTHVFDELVDPGRPVSAASVRVHGITPAMLGGKPPLAEVLPRFRGFCADCVLIAHNAAFDLRFLQRKEAATGIRFDQPVLDTALLSAALNPALRDHSLEAIAARLAVRLDGRHNALGDAIIAAEIFVRLLPLLAAAGITTLRAACAASRHAARTHPNM